jgi:hypothetical protein
LRHERREEEIWKGSCLTHPTKGPTRQKGDRGGDSEGKGTAVEEERRAEHTTELENEVLSRLKGRESERTRRGEEGERKRRRRRGRKKDGRSSGGRRRRGGE